MALGVIAGYDALDATSEDVPVADYSRAIRTPTSKFRVGIPRTPFFENLAPEVAKAVAAALDVLRKLTAGVKDVQIPAAGNIAEVSYRSERIPRSVRSISREPSRVMYS